MVRSNQMSEEAAVWLTQTLDVFHDTEQLPVGYPDITGGSSFIQTVVLTKNLPITAPKDFHIYSMPQLTQRDMYQSLFTTPSTLYSGPTASYSNNGGLVGPLNIAVAEPTAPTMPYYDGVTDTFQPCPEVELYSFDLAPYLVGNSRLVSMAFEVINTGPDLLKSGSIVTYRAPQTVDISQVVFDDEGLGAYSHAIRRSQLPPATVGDALALHGSQQWEAREGAYCINTMISTANPAGTPDYLDQLYQSTLKTALNAGGISLTPRRSSLFPSTAEKVQMAPWNTTGAYVSGAQTGTVLTVVLKAYIECFPNPDQKAFVTLTRPAVAYDPTALEVYARAAFHLKPATKVGNNPDGEFFRVVGRLIAAAVPRIPQMISIGKEIGKVAKDVQQTANARRALVETKGFGSDANAVKKGGNKQVAKAAAARRR